MDAEIGILGNLMYVCFLTGLEVQGNFSALSTARNLQVGPQFTCSKSILLKPDVLCAMPTHMLQWNGLERASFEVHERQRDVRLKKLVVTSNHNYPR
jgi:hypothetical protein